MLCRKIELIPTSIFQFTVRSHFKNGSEITSNFYYIYAYYYYYYDCLCVCLLTKLSLIETNIQGVLFPRRHCKLVIVHYLC